MERNLSTAFPEECSTKINFEYTEMLCCLVAVTAVTALYYNCYRRFSFRKFPSCSLEFFSVYVRLSGRYLGELPISTAIFTFVIALAKYFGKEGLFIVWCLQPHLLIFHERYVKILLNDEASTDKPLAYDLVSDMIGKSLLTVNGCKWKQTKKTLSPLFRFEKLKSTVTTLNERAEDVVKNIAKAGNNATIDALPILKMGVLKSLSEGMLDFNLNDADAELVQYIEATSRLGRSTVDRFLRPWLWWKHSLPFFTEGRKLLKQYKEMRVFAKQMIGRMMPNSTILNTESENGQNKKKKLLLSIYREKFRKDPSFTMQDAEDAISNLLFAGFDTTSHTLIWCLFMLGLHQDVQEKAFEEIDSVTKQGTTYIDYYDLKNLKYLESIIKETLRLYPAVPFFARETKKELKFGNYIVPKNTTVFVALYLLHRNPESFPDPDKFDPERFYGKSLEDPWTYIPFSEGIRSCVGKVFGMMQMKIILAHILKNFKITSLDKTEDIWLDVKIVLTPLTPIRLQFTDRRSDS